MQFLSMSVEEKKTHVGTSGKNEIIKMRGYIVHQSIKN